MASFSLAEFDSSRKRIVLLLLTFVIVDSIIAVFMYTDSESGRNSRNAVTNIEVTITSGIATSFAILVVARQGLSGLHGRTYAALAIGIAMWSIGEIIWTYDEVALHLSLPSDSLADAFWLIGYGFFGYHLFRTYLYFDKTVNKWIAITISVGAGLVIWNLIYQMFLMANFESAEAILTFIFRIGYPVGDFLILVPSILLLITLRTSKLHFSPWFFISLSLFVTSIADIVFAYVSFANLPDAEWMAAPVYNFAYLAMAGGLYWYERFVIFDEKRFAPKLSEKNE